MKKILFICMFSGLALLILFVVSIIISPPGKNIIKSAETKKFIDSTIKLDNNVKKATIFTQNAALQFEYTLKNEPSKEELTNIFNVSYDFLKDNDSLKDLVLHGSKDVCIYIRYKEDFYEYRASNFVYNNAENSKSYNTWTLFKNNVILDTLQKDNNLY